MLMEEEDNPRRCCRTCRITACQWYMGSVQELRWDSVHKQTDSRVAALFCSNHMCVNPAFTSGVSGICWREELLPL